VYPEVRDGRFEVDMSFVGAVPPGIRRGQSLQIRLELGDQAEALLLARGGFYQTTGGQWVYVVDPGGDFATRRSIRLGRQNPQNFEVLEGLAPGEQVITSGYENYGDIEKLMLNR
jgi:HlyD family secretion protein